MYKVIDWEKDVADKWRIRVEIGGSTVAFKFEEWPDDEVLQSEAARYDTMMQEQAAIRDAIMQKEQEEYELGLKEQSELPHEEPTDQDAREAMTQGQPDDATDPE